MKLNIPIPLFIKKVSGTLRLNKIDNYTLLTGFTIGLFNLKEENSISLVAKYNKATDMAEIIPYGYVNGVVKRPKNPYWFVRLGTPIKYRFVQRKNAGYEITVNNITYAVKVNTASFGWKLYSSTLNRI